MSHKSFGMLCSVALCLLLAGCRTVKVIEQVPVEVHDTMYKNVVQHDSTYIDRWHTEYVKGDTVYITNEVTKTVTKIKVDTTYRYIEKPVVVSKMETVEVEKQLTWWQKGLMWMGLVCLIGLVGWVVWKTKRWWLKWIR